MAARKSKGWTDERRAKFQATIAKKRNTPDMESMLIPVAKKPRKKAVKRATMGRKRNARDMESYLIPVTKKPRKKAVKRATMGKKRNARDMESYLIPVTNKPRKKAGAAFRGSVWHSIGNTSFLLPPNKLIPKDAPCKLVVQTFGRPVTFEDTAVQILSFLAANIRKK